MVEIIFEDEYIIAVKKLPGMLSEASPSTDSLPFLLKEEKGLEVFPLHRLDKPVGGAIIYAKTKKAATLFSAMISQNALQKKYLAVLEGIPEKDEAILTDLLFKDSRKNKTFVVKKMRKGVREARLSYRIRAKTEASALAEITLETGRSHQIRVQFASRKTPVRGDGKYGSRDNRCTAALWSYSLSFVHPFTKENTDIVCSPDMTQYPWSSFKTE